MMSLILQRQGICSKEAAAKREQGKRARVCKEEGEKEQKEGEPAESL